MWQSKENKTWGHYRDDILAIDVDSAQFIADYIRHSFINSTHLSSIRIIDLQRYKIIRQPRKVKSALRERSAVPFVFIACNN